MSIKRVAVIGTGPSGAIAVDALVQEGAFDVIRVFERQEKAGGNWVSRKTERAEPLDINNLSTRTADKPVEIPSSLPCHTPSVKAHRYTDSHIYPNLHTNVDASVMEYSGSDERIPTVRSEWSIGLHGEDTPFRHHEVICGYVESLLERNGYQDLVQYNTTVERAVKDEEMGEWVLTLRKAGTGEEGKEDYWWTETFDALVVASGHYHVPYVPSISGLKEFAERYPGNVEHAKQYRGPTKYKGKRVVTIGASVSAADTAVSLINSAQTPIYSVTRGKYNIYFGDHAFKHPSISLRPAISHIEPKSRTVHFEDGTSVSDVDHLIFGTGFTWTLPFLPQIPIRNNRVPDLYLHVFHQSDPSLIFLGAVGAGLTFKVFEWQAVAAARVLAGRAKLPPLEEQKRWEEDRIAVKGDGAGFLMVNPDFETYFEQLRAIAGEPVGKGRRLPAFEQKWVDDFSAGHERRIRMWKRANEAAAAEVQKVSAQP
ncbi:uncharacterized protein DSM5745_03410 [Aspergillus mulundensis]|uniref:Monooxygenase n=1 Tax=Aspergillus mulundensis TaxID=1810919 RepID=A0A3D8SLT6_9EURO|nr:Uncharacterized protein DSM5745_03410 [Aspergillus mulundensis]RDW86768.1 Uncharacterized protein DSM5745_03410 [Aspergillus mulundensis]